MHTGWRWIAMVFGLTWALPAHATPAKASPRVAPPVTANAPELAARIDVDQLDTTRLAAAIFHETNRVRTRFDLPAFRWLPELDRAADLQASSTALGQVAGHANWFPALATPADRVRHVGLRPRAVGENAAMLAALRFDPIAGYFVRKETGPRVFYDGRTEKPVEPHTYASFATAVVDAWMKSPGHRAAILNPEFHYLGCSGRHSRTLNGLDLISCVQVFYTPF